jgi:hypothetical protein
MHAFLVKSRFVQSEMKAKASNTLVSAQSCHLV